jgi:hypothetical protein
MFGSKKSKKDKSAKQEHAAPTYHVTPTYTAPAPPPPAPVVYAPEPVADPEVVSQELVMAAQGAALDNHNKELVNRTFSVSTLYPSVCDLVRWTRSGQGGS